ncbi:FecR family protein [Pedobacter gandavensis]|uniref:FecR family protein n=1 Tax=Pedobacter gandavensis TaxID=2679963 RepID=UPI00292F5272|nr:FecR domain-containing protein [Pedobacter gandavensis]
MIEDPEKLLDKYHAGLCTEEEIAVLESWYLKLSSDDVEGLDVTSAERTKVLVWAALNQHKDPVKRLRFRYWAAAATLCLLGFSIYFYSRPASIKEELAHHSSKNHTITPGSNKAILTMSNGRKISLTDVNNGEIVKQEGLSITKTADGKIVYTLAGAGKNGTSDRNTFHTIETPKGGHYQINFPDGSKVWLNSASSLRYQTKFTGKLRKVSLSGEAYFEIAKSHIPFVVNSRGQEVQVLGTHFNINSYADEEKVKTTLLEGSVRVTPSDPNKNPRLLKPGEQSQLNEAGIKVQDVDIESIVAWKNGDFIFQGDDLKSIMKQLARWYDVEVVYRGNCDHLKFGGYISRSKNISAVLNIMESTGKVDFQINGKVVTVSEIKK